MTTLLGQGGSELVFADVAEVEKMRAEPSPVRSLAHQGFLHLRLRDPLMVEQDAVEAAPGRRCGHVATERLDGAMAGDGIELWGVVPGVG